MRADDVLVGSAYESDPVLRAIDPEIMPQEFVRLSDADQRWRGRLYMAVFWMSHHVAFSWATALSEDDRATGDWRQLMEDTPDDLLLARYRGAAAEIAVETGAIPGPTQ